MHKKGQMGRSFKPSRIIPCVFFREDCIVQCYVDDCIIFTKKNCWRADRFVQSLHNGHENSMLEDEGLTAQSCDHNFKFSIWYVYLRKSLFLSLWVTPETVHVYSAGEILEVVDEIMILCLQKHSKRIDTNTIADYLISLHLFSVFLQLWQLLSS